MGNTACGDLCNTVPQEFRAKHSESELPAAKEGEAVKLSMENRDKDEAEEDKDLLKVNEDFRRHEEANK